MPPHWNTAVEALSPQQGVSKSTWVHLHLHFPCTSPDADFTTSLTLYYKSPILSPECHFFSPVGIQREAEYKVKQLVWLWHGRYLEQEAERLRWYGNKSSNDII